ncbi:MAG: methionyl aminopeptidase [Verrucomicrobia bacterium]|nr:methionyl aminopeptidase [Verrucomicrobiota bacterium]
MERNDPCWCRSGQKWKKCHYPEEPRTSTLAQEYQKQFGILLKTPAQIEGIRRSCKLAAAILQALCQKAEAGMTTNQLNDFANQLHRQAGAIPAPLGYGDPPFPKSICTSINDVICHGIPDNTPLVEGDILNIDVTCILEGYYGDCSAMVEIGKISSDKRKVVDVSQECLRRAIALLKPGMLLSQIGQVIEDYARLHHCSVVNQFVGLGTGVAFHEPPQVPHHYNDMALLLVEGMTFTIEPMINAGVREGVIDSKDKWTVRTADGKPSAQWEHTVLITSSGHEILTLL